MSNDTELTFISIQTIINKKEKNGFVEGFGIKKIGYECDLLTEQKKTDTN